MTNYPTQPTPSHVWVIGGILTSVITITIWMGLAPNIGLGGLIAYPMAIVVGLVGGILTNIIMKTKWVIGVKVLLLAILFVLQAFILLYYLPQDGGNAFWKLVEGR